MGEPQQRLLAVAREQYIDDAALGAEGHQQMAGRLAGQDVSAGVTFKLEVPTLTEISGDRKEPAA